MEGRQLQTGQGCEGAGQRLTRRQRRQPQSNACQTQRESNLTAALTHDIGHGSAVKQAWGGGAVVSRSAAASDTLDGMPRPSSLPDYLQLSPGPPAFADPYRAPSGETLRAAASFTLQPQATQHDFVTPFASRAARPRQHSLPCQRRPSRDTAGDDDLLTFPQVPSGGPPQAPLYSTADDELLQVTPFLPLPLPSVFGGGFVGFNICRKRALTMTWLAVLLVAYPADHSSSRATGTPTPVPWSPPMPRPPG